MFCLIKDLLYCLTKLTLHVLTSLSFPDCSSSFHLTFSNCISVTIYRYKIIEPGCMSELLRSSIAAIRSKFFLASCTGYEISLFFFQVCFSSTNLVKCLFQINRLRSAILITCKSNLLAVFSKRR